MDEIKPALVIIDSLIGCSSGDAFDENKSSFASPLYWLSKQNGNMFPATTILIIHHANKTGGFRGTSSINDGVDETWGLKKPDDKSELPRSSRVITIEKSRSGRSGTSLLMNMEADLTFSISDFTPEIDEQKTTPDGIVDRVLMKIRTIYPRAITREDLNSDPVVGGRVAAIRKSLQRLVKKGLIEVAEETKRGGKGGKPTHHYKAVLARGEGGGECPITQNPSTGTDKKWDKQKEKEELSHLSEEKGQGSTPGTGCPIPKPLQEKGSTQKGQPDKYIHARTDDELNSCMDQNQWDAPVVEVMPMSSTETFELLADSDSWVDV
jgi:hypothetical protein